MSTRSQPQYLIVIGDVISSREVQERDRLQNQLKNVFKDISREKKHLVSPYTLTLGDEFQAVYRSAISLFHDALFILENVYPHKIRFSYGIGEISTEINREQSLGMDGEGFYRARDGMEWVKSQRGKYRFVITGLKEEYQPELLNNTLFLISNLIDGWKFNRISILRRRLDGEKIKSIADALGISETAVYTNIYDGSIREIIRLFSLIADKLDTQVKQP